uniref:Uncharacterized protein n=1 Tax=Globodera rostochiensis TaxID=31243 RepID=A0A914GQR1_GLORO
MKCSRALQELVSDEFSSLSFGDLCAAARTLLKRQYGIIVLVEKIVEFENCFIGRDKFLDDYEAQPHLQRRPFEDVLLRSQYSASWCHCTTQPSLGRDYASLNRICNNGLLKTCCSDKS